MPSIFVGLFPQKSPVINGSLAGRDLQLKASYTSPPPFTCGLVAGKSEFLEKQVDNKFTRENDRIADLGEILPVANLAILVRNFASCYTHAHTHTHTRIHKILLLRATGKKFHESAM